MPRQKKDSRPLNIKMDRELFEQLEEFCSLTGISKTLVVERGVKMFLESTKDLMDAMKVHDK